jgi:excisionase family DNA binding protein
LPKQRTEVLFHVGLILGELAEAISSALADRVATKMGNSQAPLMDVDQLAGYLGVPKGWIYDRTRLLDNPIPHLKVGKYLRFDLEEVMNWLRNRND